MGFKNMKTNFTFADISLFNSMDGKPNREFLALNKIEDGIMYPEGHET